MAYNGLDRFGLYFDELNKIRAWDPEAANKTRDLSDVSNDFVQSKKYVTHSLGRSLSWD